MHEFGPCLHYQLASCFGVGFILLGPHFAGFLRLEPLRRLQLCQHLRGLAIPPNLAGNLGQEVQFDSS